MTYRELSLSFPDAHFPGKCLDHEVTGIFSDSRSVVPGSAFIAVRGVAADGTAYAGAALSSGAEFVMGEGPAPDRIPGESWVSVPDARAAVAAAACAVNGNPSRSMDVYGVTGTNGKTTTASVLAEILNSSGVKCGLLSTVRRNLGDLIIPSEHTTSDAAVFQSDLAHMRSSGCRAASVEVSSHSLDQKRVDGTVFRAAAFTNLTRDHLDYHKTMENYGAAKWRLFELLSSNPDGFAVINSDDECGAAFAEKLKTLGVRTYTYGIAGSPDFRAENVRLSVSGTEFDFVTPFGTAHITSMLMGGHNVSNLLAASAMAAGSGISAEKIAAAIAVCKPVRGRLERVAADEYKPAVFVDYAHTPDALERVLKTLREVTAGKLIVVFGCGGDRDRGKRPQMGAISGRLADSVVLTSDNPRSEEPQTIINEILDGVKASGNGRIMSISDRRAAIKAAISLVHNTEDTVLVAGKGHETTQTFASKTIHFDDREEIAALLV